MQQIEAFHEDVYDALRALVTALGGWKRVGSELWPDKPIDQAGNWLRDCLNPEHRSKLDIDQLLYLLKRGAEQGIHVGMYFITDYCNYEQPRYRTPDEVAAEAKNELASLLDRQEQLIKRLEALK